MGPRSHDHGYNINLLPTTTMMVYLQWGRGLTTTDTLHSGRQSSGGTCRFKRAAVSRPRTPVPPANCWPRLAVLQWGRGLTTTDTQGTDANQPAPYQASRGPQSYDRGYAAQWSPEFGWDMRLQWGRGLTTTDTRCGASVSTTKNHLQWGRGLATTDTAARKLYWNNGMVLQWGRGLTTTDTLHSGRQSSGGTCRFKRAAVLRPRRLRVLP